MSRNHWQMHRFAAVSTLMFAAVVSLAALHFGRANERDRAASSGAIPGNVRHFGARGDGTTDDTAAIQRAVDNSQDGMLTFPRGDYRITRPIVIGLNERERTSITGHAGVGRIIMAGSGPAFRFVGTHNGSADPPTFQPSVWHNQRMPRIEGLEILGAHPEADGVEFVKVMQPTLSHVLIREVRHGIRLVERDRNLLLDACHIYNCRGVGVFFDRVNLHQANILGCHISYCKGGGIKIVGSEIRNLQITGNDIEYNYDPNAKQSADVWIDTTEGSVREATITGNTIQAKVSPGGANVRLLGPADINKIGLFTIAGNHISNQTVNVHLKNCRGVVFTGNSLCWSQERNLLIEGSRHIVVGANSFDHNPDYKQPTKDGIALRNCDGCAIHGAMLEGTTSGSNEAGGAIELVDCRETTIQGCQVFEPSFRGIYVSGCRNTRIAGCTVMDRPGGGNLIAAIEVAGRSTGTSIRGNLVDQGSQGDILMAPNSGTSNGNQAVLRK